MYAEKVVDSLETGAKRHGAFLRLFAYVSWKVFVQRTCRGRKIPLLLVFSSIDCRAFEAQR